MAVSSQETLGGLALSNRTDTHEVALEPAQAHASPVTESAPQRVFGTCCFCSETLNLCLKWQDDRDKLINTCHSTSDDSHSHDDNSI